MDELFDDVENAEHALALETHTRQVLIADTPDPAVYGGIVEGLLVTGTPANDYVSVSLGKARDNQGRRIYMPGAPATVKITHTGVTDDDDVTDALGNGGAIVGSCALTNYIIASLWIVYSQVQSNPKVDGLGATIQYDLEESFHFEIQIMTAFPNPPVATPTRQALADGKVLLADLILTNSGSNIILVDVMETTPDWDARGSYYANLDGRRSSWLTVQTEDEFDEADAAQDFIRAGSAREALYDLGKKVRSQAIIVHRPEGSPAVQSLRSIYGHPIEPDVIFNDRMTHTDNDIVHTGTPHFPGWTFAAVGGGAIAWATDNFISGPATSLPGIALTTKNVGGEGVEMYTRSLWNAGVAPFLIASFRFQIITGFNAVDFKLGVGDHLATQRIYLHYVGATLYGQVSGSTGAWGAPVDLAASMTLDTWYTIRMAIVDASTVLFQLNNGPWTEIPLSGVDTFASAPLRLYATADAQGAAIAKLAIGHAFCSAGQLSSDHFTS